MIKSDKIISKFILDRTDFFKNIHPNYITTCSFILNLILLYFLINPNIYFFILFLFHTIILPFRPCKLLRLLDVIAVLGRCSQKTVFRPPE